MIDLIFGILKGFVIYFGFNLRFQKSTVFIAVFNIYFSFVIFAENAVIYLMCLFLNPPEFVICIS